MNPSIVRSFSLVGVTFAVLASFVACAPQNPVESHEPDLGQVSQELTATDPVSKAVTDSCTTTSVRALSEQLIDEIQCLKPGVFTKLNVPNTDLGAAVFPYLQTPAAAALAKVAASRTTALSINSALRSLPQQLLLFRWYKTGRCGIGLAAQPGQSNHESGLAVDVDNYSAWKPYFEANGFKWLGASDTVHFDYTGPGSVDIDGLSVYAFQRLWNRNHPEDPIAEDKSYGSETEARLLKSPVGGFAIGAKCDTPAVDAGTDAPVLVVVDSGSTTKVDAGTAPSGTRETAVSEDGCTMHHTNPERTFPRILSVSGLALLLAIVRRRTREAAPRA